MATVMDYFNGNIEAGKTTTLSDCPPIGDVEKQLREVSLKGIELTVTFKPELQLRWKPRTLTRMVKDIMSKRKCKAVLIGEYSQTGMYHMHGSILADPRAINGMKREMARDIGRCEFKCIRYVDSWVEYCLKENGDKCGTNIKRKDILVEELIIL